MPSPSVPLTGQRLADDHAYRLGDLDALHETAALAAKARARLHGDKAFYVRNRHINFTNICVNACRFCAFSRRHGDRDAYVLGIDEAVASLDAAGPDMAEIHVVGGLNPELPLAYYVDLLTALHAARPKAVIKAFTAVEIAHLADTGGASDAHILETLRKAGLAMLPGGGAEVFDSKLRARLCPEKVTAARWLAVHAAAHGLGIRTNATLLFGHVESFSDRVAHLLALREQQDKSGGFVCFVPLPYQPGLNELGPEAGSGPGGADILLTIAAARLILDNFPHIKAYWPFMGLKMAQLALAAGADDLDGSIVEEKIGHAAGADTPKGLTVEELRQAVTQAGFTPVERDGLFREITR